MRDVEGLSAEELEEVIGRLQAFPPSTSAFAPSLCWGLRPTPLRTPTGRTSANERRRRARSSSAEHAPATSAGDDELMVGTSPPTQAHPKVSRPR